MLVDVSDAADAAFVAGCDGTTLRTSVDAVFDTYNALRSAAAGIGRGGECSNGRHVKLISLDSMSILR